MEGGESRKEITIPYSSRHRILDPNDSRDLKRIYVHTRTENHIEEREA